MDRYAIALEKKPPNYGFCCNCGNFDDAFGGDFKERIPECRECRWLLPGTKDNWKEKFV